MLLRLIDITNDAASAIAQASVSAAAMNTEGWRKGFVCDITLASSAARATASAEGIEQWHSGITSLGPCGSRGNFAAQYLSTIA